MTSKEALMIIKHSDSGIPEGLVTEAFQIIKKDLELLETILYGVGHSSQTQCELPDGKKIICDMGYVEEFINKVKEWLENDK